MKFSAPAGPHNALHAREIRPWCTGAAPRPLRRQPSRKTQALRRFRRIRLHEAHDLLIPSSPGCPPHSGCLHAAHDIRSIVTVRHEGAHSIVTLPAELFATDASPCAWSHIIHMSWSEPSIVTLRRLIGATTFHMRWHCHLVKRVCAECPDRSSTAPSFSSSPLKSNFFIHMSKHPNLFRTVPKFLFPTYGNLLKKKRKTPRSSRNLSVKCDFSWIISQRDCVYNGTKFEATQHTTHDTHTTHHTQYTTPHTTHDTTHDTDT